MSKAWAVFRIVCDTLGLVRTVHLRCFIVMTQQLQHLHTARKQCRGWDAAHIEPLARVRP